MGFVFRSSCESQAILNFKSHTECHRLTRKQHARSSLMKSLASYLRCCQQSLVLHSCIIFIYIYICSFAEYRRPWGI